MDPRFFIKKIVVWNFCPALTKLALDLHVNLAMFVCTVYGVRSFFSRLYLSKRPSSFWLIHFWGSSGAARLQNRTFEGRRPLTEDDLWWKTTFDKRRPLMKDNLGQKMTSDKDDLRQKTSFNVRQPLIGCIVY